jgi:hypothetical protein
MIRERNTPASIASDGDGALGHHRSRRATILTVGVLAALIVLIVLLTPVTDGDEQTRLDPARFGPGNARLAADLIRRFGWVTENAATPFRGTPDTSVIYAVFEGPTPMRTAELNALLGAVRRGAGLLVAPKENTAALFGRGGDFPLLDSLGLRTRGAGKVHARPLGACTPTQDPLAAIRVRSRMLTFDTATVRRGAKTARLVPYPSGAEVLLASDVAVDDSITAKIERNSNKTPALDSTVTTAPGESLRVNAAIHGSGDSTGADVEAQPTVVAFALGRGRVVALADPDILRNDQMRNCAMGSALTVIRGFEYLSIDRRRPVVFATYYQGVTSDGPGRVLWEWLRDSRPGRMVLTLIAACVLLLGARGRRTLAPVYRDREERRSALEHVDALATAWRAVRGTRTVSRMLARGIRRRHAAGRWRTLDDASFLAALAERHPAIANDVATLTLAMEVPAAPSELPTLRKAAARIDAECLAP